MPMTLTSDGQDADGVARGRMLIPQGDDLSLVITVTTGGVATDLTGYVAKAQVKSASATVLTFASSGSSTITLGATSGTITLAQSAVVTAALTPGLYAWDLQWVTSAGATETIMRGECSVTPEVTT